MQVVRDKPGRGSTKILQPILNTQRWGISSPPLSPLTKRAENRYQKRRRREPNGIAFVTQLHFPPLKKVCKSSVPLIKNIYRYGKPHSVSHFYFKSANSSKYAGGQTLSFFFGERSSFRKPEALFFLSAEGYTRSSSKHHPRKEGWKCMHLSSPSLSHMDLMERVRRAEVPSQHTGSKKRCFLTPRSPTLHFCRAFFLSRGGHELHRFISGGDRPP